MCVYCEASVFWVEGRGRLRKEQKRQLACFALAVMEQLTVSLSITHTPKPLYPPPTSLPVSPQVRAPHYNKLIFVGATVKIGHCGNTAQQEHYTLQIQWMQTWRMCWVWSRLENFIALSPFVLIKDVFNEIYSFSVKNTNKPVIYLNPLEFIRLTKSKTILKYLFPLQNSFLPQTDDLLLNLAVLNKLTIDYLKCLNVE